jgi:CO/xanthine dehydrogenase FAD-binding subunit
MKPAPFEYCRPRTREEALALLERYGGDARPLAGGQSLIPAMNFRLARPRVLVDLNAIDDLACLEPLDGGGLRLGAMTRQRAVERSDLAAREAPLLHEAMPFIAHAAIRSRGTVGGSLAHADPAAELPAVMLALDARFVVESRGGSRRIAAADFFTGLFTTALDPGSLLAAIEISWAPRPAERRGWAFLEVSRRRGDFALLGVAVSVTVGADLRCAGARITLLSAGDRPMLAVQASRAIVGEAPSADAIRAAGDAAAHQDIDPTSDIHASSRFRRQLAAVLTRRALERAFALARARREAGFDVPESEGPGDDPNPVSRRSPS